MRANAEARFKKKVKKIMFSTPGSFFFFFLSSFLALFARLFFFDFSFVVLCFVYTPSLSPPARRQWTSSFVPFEILKLL